jgi:ribosomal protein S18 acetylase RimI-like enzyme
LDRPLVIHASVSLSEDVKRVRERHDPKSYRGTTIRRVNWSKDIDTVRRLFEDYRQWLADHQDPAAPASSGGKLGLGEIDEQISELPGPYGPPRGEIVLAFAGGAVVACGALRELDPRVGEIKRIYVRADHRGPGFGPRLTRALLRRARELRYERVRVDTLPTMAAAIQFYQELGFAPIAAYWPHPVPGALFFEYKMGKPTRAHRSRRASDSRKSRK